MENQASGLFTGIGGLLYMGLIVVVFAGMWKLFVKAGKPGWASLVPIYNIIVMHEIIGREAWKIVLYFIPLANIYFLITLYVNFAKSFGKYGIGNYLGILFLSFIFVPLWGFSQDTQYVGPSEGPNAVAGTSPAMTPTY